MKKVHHIRNKRIAALTASGLMVIMLAGCSQSTVLSSGNQREKGTANNALATGQGTAGTSDTTNNTGSSTANNAASSTSGHAAGNTALSNQVSNNVPTASAEGPMTLSDEPGKILYGSYKYTIPLPATDKVGNLTHVTAIDIPGGILWMTPSGFPDKSRAPLPVPALWFTSAATKGGDIWNGAKLLHQFSPGQTPFIVGVTNGFAIVRVGTGGQTGSSTTSNTASGTADVVSVTAYSIKDGHAVSIGKYQSSDQTTWGQGVFAWTDSKYNVHVVQVSTGKQDTISLPSQPSSLGISPGGIQISQKFVPVSFVKDTQYPPLPSTFHWVYMGQSQYPVMQVPKNWTVVQHIPGGSSVEVIASNPKDKNEQVTVSLNACAGCYDPTVISDQLIQSFDSPLLGAEKGETYVWLNDHDVAYTLPPGKNNPYPTYGLTLTFPLQSGNEEVEVNVPQSDKQLATEILNGILSGKQPS